MCMIAHLESECAGACKGLVSGRAAARHHPGAVLPRQVHRPVLTLQSASDVTKWL